MCAQSYLTLCKPVECSPPGSSVHGILQARILEWVAMPSSRGFPNPGIEPVSSVSLALTGKFFTVHLGKSHMFLIFRAKETETQNDYIWNTITVFWNTKGHQHEESYPWLVPDFFVLSVLGPLGD